MTEEVDLEIQFIEDAVKELARARLELQHYSDVVERRADELEQTPEWQDWNRAKTDKKAWQSTEREFYTALAMLAENTEGRHGKHPHPAVQLQERKKVVYTEADAIKWCLMRAPELVKMTLNKEAFEDLVRSETIDMADVAVIETYWKAAISQDLSAYIGGNDGES